MKIKFLLVLTINIFALLSFTITSRALTYTVTNTNDSGAGSLRQAITDANGTAIDDIISFNIPTSDPGYDGSNGWFLIELNSLLPDITDTVQLDGSTQTINVGDTNPGYIGIGGTVGVDELTLNQVPKPEIVLAPASAGTIARGIRVLGSGANGSVINNIATYGFGPASSNGNSSFANVTVVNADNVTLSNSIIGTDPDIYDDPPIPNTSKPFTAAGTFNGLTIENNIFGPQFIGLFFLVNDSVDVPITGVVIRDNEFVDGGDNGAGDAVEIQAGINDISILLEGNLFTGNNAREQIDLVGANGGLLINSTITNNTIIDSNVLAPPTPGIRLREVQSSTFSKNIIQNNNGPGILVNTSTSPTFPNGSYGNRITQNHFGSNDGLAIELCENCGSASQGDGVNVNDGILNNTIGNMGMDHPIITDSITINSNSIYIEGTAMANSTIEFYRAEADTDGFDIVSSTGYGEGTEYLGSLTSDGSGIFAGTINYSNVSSLVGDEITALAIDSSDNTSEFGPNFLISQTSGIGLIKELSNFTNVGDGSYNVTFKFTISNTGNSDLANLQLRDDLTELFNDGSNFSIVTLTSSGLTINTNYNGDSDINLLTGSNNLLIGESQIVLLTINFFPNNSQGTYENLAYASAENIIGVTLEDTSHPSSILSDSPTVINIVELLANTGDATIYLLLLGIFLIGFVILRNKIHYSTKELITLSFLTFFSFTVFILTTLIFTQKVNAQVIYPDWYDTNWSHRKIYSITTDNSQIPASVSNFPFTLVIDNDTDLKENAKSDASDLLILLDNSTELDYEIESYDSVTGSLVVHILIPNLDGGESLYVYFGNPDITVSSNPLGVWDSSHIGVWHMQTLENEVPDSTSNGNDGTVHNGVTRSSTGLFGNSYSFDGVDDYVSTIPVSWGSMDEYTLCVWFKPANFPAYPYRQVVVGAYPHEFSVLLEENQINFYNGYWLWTGGNLTTADWYNYCGTFNTTTNTVRSYLNGVNIRTDSFTGTPEDHAGNPNLDFGAGYGWTWYVRNYFNGQIDEVRLLDRELSSNEVRALYSNQANTSNFYTLEEEQELTYIILNLDSNLEAVRKDDQLIDVTSEGQVGEVLVLISQGSIPVAEININFDEDHDWSAAKASTVDYKTFFHYPGGSSSLPGTISTGYTLYVQKGTFDFIGVCPNAQNLDDVNKDCEGIYYLNESDSNVSIVEVDGEVYWLVSNLPGTGVFSSDQPTLAATGTDLRPLFISLILSVTIYLYTRKKIHYFFG